MKRLIINADDFGLAPGVNRAILELQQAGALSSATLMANGPFFSPAVYMAFAQPALAVGCHVVLVDGSPCLRPAEVPSLVDPLNPSVSEPLWAASSPICCAAASARKKLRPRR